MRIVGGEGGEAAAFGQELVEQIPAVAAVAFDGAAVIVDLDRMGAVDGAAVLDRELRPGGMGDADEGAGLGGAPGELRRRFPLCAQGSKSSGRPAATMCHSSPTWVSGACSSEPMMVVKLLERMAARVGDRPVEIADEVIGQHHEIVAGILIGIDHLVGRERAIGQGRMRVEIAAPEAAGKREGGEVGMESGSS